MFEILTSTQLDFNKPILEIIGFNGPNIVSIITILMLIRRIPYLVFFILFSVLNEQFNKLLKVIIKEERPKDGKSFSNENYEGAQKYGMPSGHSQSIFFSILFLYLSTKSIWLLILTMFIATLTVYQRISSRKHTVEQLFFGTIIGAIDGYIAYQLTKRFLETKRTPIR